MRMTYLKRQILEALRPPRTKERRIEDGLPPYSSSDVARLLNHPNPASVAKTLRNMEADGLITSEVTLKPVWAHLSRQRFVDKRVKCYWNTEHIEADKVETARQAEEAKRISEEMMENFLCGN